MLNTIVFYSIIIFVSVVFMYLSTKKTRKVTNLPKRKGIIRVSTIFFLLSVLVPFLVLILRDESVGLDYSLYINLYNRFLSNTLLPTDSSWVSFGYVFLTKLCIFLFDSNYYIFFGIIGFVSIYCFFKTIYEESDIPWLSLLLLFSFCLYYQMFNQFRQMLAIAISFYGYKYIKNKDLKKYIFTILIAYSMHKSAIIMLPFYWISNLKLQKRGILFYSILSVVAYLAYDFVEVLLLKTSYGQTYLANSYYNVVESSSMLNLVFRFMLFMLCFYLTRKTRKTNSEINTLFNLCFVCVIFQIMTVKSYVFGRITTYFFVYFILLIPKAIKSINMSRNSKLYIYSLIIFACLAYHYVYFTTKAASGFGVGIYRLLNLN